MLIRPVTLLIAAVLLAAFLIAWNWMPKDFKTKDRTIFPLFILAVLAIVTTAFSLRLSPTAQLFLTFAELLILPEIAVHGEGQEYTDLIRRIYER